MDFILKYWIEVLFGFMISFATYILHRIKKEYQTLELMKETLCDLTYSHMVELSQELRDQETIELYDKERFNELYQQHHALSCEKRTDAKDLKRQIDKKKIS